MSTQKRKRVTISLSTLFIILATAPAYSDVIDTTYWDNAVEIAEKNKCLTPLNIVETEEVSDEEGKPLENNVTHIQVIKKGGNSLDIKLVSREENGEDNTKNFFKDFIANKPETLAELKEEGLFEKSAQHLIKLTGFVLENNMATYTFTVTADGVPFKGRAKIDTNNGHAVYTKVTTPLMEDDGAVISNYEEITHFKTDGDRWYTEKVIENMELELGGFFSSFKGNVHAETILADYFCHK